MENLPANPNGFNALSPQQQQDHRAKIGVRARTILRQFWFDDDVSDAEQALEIEGWIDVLESCSHSEIRKAWAKYQRTGPRTKAGKLYKPDAGALLHMIWDARPRPRVVRTDRPETQQEREAYQQSVARNRIDPERKKQAEEIMASFKTGNRE